MRMPDPARSSGAAAAQTLQRKCAECEKDDEKLLTKSAQPGGAADREAPAIVHDVLRSPGQPLSPSTRAFFEPRFGRDFSQVRVHADDRAAESARSVDSLAYAVGGDLVFAGGQYAPESNSGRRLLAHELAHVVQQTQGGSPVRVARTPPGPKKFQVNSGDLEHLQRILLELMNKLSDKTRTRIIRNDTVVVALVTDSDGDQSLVYTVAKNRNYPGLEAAAEELGITPWDAEPRASGRGDVGAPGDAEQIAIEAADANDMTIEAMAVTRNLCPDCKEAVAAEGEEGGIPVVRVSVPLPESAKAARRAARAAAKGPSKAAPGGEEEELQTPAGPKPPNQSVAPPQPAEEPNQSVEPPPVSKAPPPTPIGEPNQSVEPPPISKAPPPKPAGEPSQPIEAPPASKPAPPPPPAEAHEAEHPSPPPASAPKIPHPPEIEEAPAPRIGLRVPTPGAAGSPHGEPEVGEHPAPRLGPRAPSAPAGAPEGEFDGMGGAIAADFIAAIAEIFIRQWMLEHYAQEVEEANEKTIRDALTAGKDRFDALVKGDQAQIQKWAAEGRTVSLAVSLMLNYQSTDIGSIIINVELEDAQLAASGLPEPALKKFEHGIVRDFVRQMTGGEFVDYVARLPITTPPPKPAPAAVPPAAAEPSAPAKEIKPSQPEKGTNAAPAKPQPPKPGGAAYSRDELFDRTWKAVNNAQAIREDGASDAERKASTQELWKLVQSIEYYQQHGVRNAEDEMGLRDMKRQLLNEIAADSDARARGAY
jgi:hypothetical protein